MHSETHGESQRTINSPAQRSGQQPSVTRTRCPACRKLFAVETETLLAMTRAGAYRAEFNCTSNFCRTTFAIALPLPVGFDGVTVVPAVQIPSTQPLQPEPSPNLELELTHRPEIDFVEDKAAVPGPTTVALKTAEPAIAPVLAEKECPRCNAKNAVTQSECVRCGIVFERYDSGAIGTKADLRLEEEMALGGTRELSALWDRLIEDYEDRVRHDRFVNACRDAKALSYAAKKYSQILVSAPQDEVARIMRNRIVALVSAQAETSKIPIRLDFRIPSMNTMALAMGSILFFWGLMMPQLKHIMEIGLSMVLLSIGVRLALRARV